MSIFVRMKINTAFQLMLSCGVNPKYKDVCLMLKQHNPLPLKKAPCS